jgi:hypothetical protein
MTRLYKIALPLFALCLLLSMIVSWGAIQDDALIHLRYADNLYLHHFVTYDGVHPDYGASSLLYIVLLAVLRAFTSSPNLPHATSAVAHLLLFAGVATLFVRRLPRDSRLARLLALALLAILILPPAVRWLEDGMETGIALCFVTLLCWLVFEQSRQPSSSPAQSIALLVAALFATLLRTEFLLLSGVCCVLLFFSRLALAQPSPTGRPSPPRIFRQLLASCAPLLGSLLACALIVWKMHVLLPDTAVAKSLGPHHAAGVFEATAIILAGALSFGVGLLLFWLLTLGLLVLESGRLTLASAAANLLFPAVLLLSASRGQEIQGARYLAWTLIFPALWNILQLGQLPPSPRPPARTSARRWAFPLAYTFLVLLALEIPVEAVLVHRVVTLRAATMRAFESEHLQALQDTHGVASDIGYIGYFTGARICDLAGLVNGRAAARLTPEQRRAACILTNPDFVFANLGQMIVIASRMDLSAWQVCGTYSFGNLTSPDTHYLAVRPGLAASACQATGQPSVSLAGLMKIPQSPIKTPVETPIKSPVN